MISIEDQRALEGLHTRFVHANDRQDYALLRSLYTGDGIEHHGAYNGPVDGFVAWLREIMPYFELTTHTMSNVLFSVNGDLAESEGRGTAYLRLKGERPYNMIVISRHFDRYRKIDGRLLFSNRALCIDWVQQFPPSDGDLEIVKASPVGTTGPDDPVYAKVPNLIASVRSALPPVG